MDRQFWLKIYTLLTVWAEDNMQQEIHRVCRDEAVVKPLWLSWQSWAIRQQLYRIRERMVQYKSTRMFLTCSLGAFLFNLCTTVLS